MLLVVDRLSDSSESRRNSQEALNQFRELALKYQNSYYTGETIKPQRKEFSGQIFKSSNVYGHPKLRLSRSKHKVNLKDKMSVMILNDGQQVTVNNLDSAIRGSSFHEILEHILHQKKKTKLSSLAKDVGFQLLSDDFEIKVINASPSESEDHPAQVSNHHSKEEALTSNDSNDDLEKGQLPHMRSISPSQHDEKSKPYSASSMEHEVTSETGDVSSLGHEEKHENNMTSSVEHGEASKVYTRSSVRHEEAKINAASVGHDERKSDHMDGELSRKIENIIVDVQTGKKLQSSGTYQYITKNQFDPSEILKMAENNILNIEMSQERPFKDSFFFSDGNYQVLKALTGESKVPSLIIVDPISQKHYVLPNGQNFSQSSMASFLENFLEGSLWPHQRSQTTSENPREAVRPPFVNMNFHEMDSVPRVTTHSLSQMVFDSGETGSLSVVNSLKDDVLVLFSMSWCGFCQRMELVVREVYRAIKSYGNMLKSRSRDGEAVFNKGK